jgi:hypothetical protein
MNVSLRDARTSTILQTQQRGEGLRTVGSLADTCPPIDNFLSYLNFCYVHKLFKIVSDTIADITFHIMF